LKKGKKALIHCRNGKGRSGLFLASCLVYKGYIKYDAIKQVRKWVPGAI
jgi:protein-tyrosine phosphatase